MIEEKCLEDESEVVLEPGGVSRLDFVFRPDNRTLSKRILARENCSSEAKADIKKKEKIKMAQSRWPAFAGVLLAAVISLVGSF